jgi:2-polyprenyl-3-methyl-5-hydroxy-6-metoxy-1,4-benzoquinol methylase
MIIRHSVRTALSSAGLLDVAREARDAVAGLAWVRNNSTVWLRGAADGLPVPPLRLVRASTGTSSLPWLFQGGALAAGSITGILSKNGISIRDVGSLLDFGCGCGRVIRHWARLGAAIHGSDYNARSIAWCRRNLTFARFEVNQIAPPLPYQQGQFDLVYALSVFTHLPEPLMFAWMREMERILKPGGFLIVSTHGEPYLGHLSPGQQAEFRSGRAVVKDEESAGTNRCGVYLPEAYVRTRLADGFRVVDFRPQGATGNPPQDLVLLQKPVSVAEPSR